MRNTTFTNTQNTGSKLNSTTLIILVIAMLPVLFFALTKIVPPVDATTAKTTAVSEAEAKRTSAAERRAQRAEARKAKKAEKTTTVSVQHGMAPDPDDISVVGVGAVVPNAPRSKQMTPYEPGTVPGDSGVMVNYVGSPDDMMSGPQPLPPDDPWGGAVLPPITPENSPCPTVSVA